MEGSFYLNACDYSAQSISQDDLDKGAILVYCKTTDNVIEPLPYSEYASNQTISLVNFIPQVGQWIVVNIQSQDGPFLVANLEGQYRFIVIPGGVEVPDSFDYKTVTDFYHLPAN